MAPLSIEKIATLINQDVAALLAVEPVALGDARPPNTIGIYMFLYENAIVYVGEANGSKGLLDRFKKHISGDEGHATQGALLSRFPDRSERREHIKKTIYARWLPIPDHRRVSAVERILIWMFDPPWNKK